MANAKKIIKKIGFSLLAIVVAVLLVVVAYAVYLLVDYSRIDDNKTLAVKNKTAETVKVGTEYSILTYNIGFCAYLPDFGFFMDGGKESRAKSKESVLTTLDGINQL